jgi:glycosyltransferase involved in cell wall biosynthesis
MSPGNIEYIKTHNPYLDSKKLILLPNWQKASNLEELTIDVREKYKLEDKYIVLFGGTIGYAQKVDNIVILAEHYQNDVNIVFLVIGNGVMKQYLKDKVAQKQLNNVIFLDSLPRNEYMNFVKSADIGLITIDERFTVPTIPSKTTSYFSLKLPVLAIIDQHTDYGKIIDEAKAGLWSVGGDNDKLFENFDKLYKDNNLRIASGENGYKYFLENLTSKHAYNTIIKDIHG